MKKIIENLNALNDLDVKLQSVRKDLARIPKELSAKEEEPRLLKEQIERRKAEVLRLKLDADSVELDLKTGQEALKRYASQLNVLRTSREFEAVKRQMEAQRRENSDHEDKALKLLQEAEEKQKEADAIAARVAELEEALAADHAAAETTLAELDAERAKMEAKRAELSADIPKAELAIYDRIVVNRGQAIAKVHKGFCSACNMKLPPQVHNLVLLGRELTTCPSCDRILTAE